MHRRRRKVEREWKPNPSGSSSPAWPRLMRPNRYETSGKTGITHDTPRLGTYFGRSAGQRGRASQRNAHTLWIVAASPHVESGRFPVCTPRVVSVSGRFRLSRFHRPGIVGRHMNASILVQQEKVAAMYALCANDISDNEVLRDRGMFGDAIHWSEVRDIITAFM